MLASFGAHVALAGGDGPCRAWQNAPEGSGGTLAGAGEDLGLLEQEMAKLAAFVGVRATIEADDVRSLVGGWRTETTWAIAGTPPRPHGRALHLLDNLLNSGGRRTKLCGLTFVLRRLASRWTRARGKSARSGDSRSGRLPARTGQSAAYLRRLGRAEALGLSALVVGRRESQRGPHDCRAANPRDSSSNSEAHLSCRAVIEPL